MTRGMLFGIGNPLLDILAKVAPGYVGRWNLDSNAQINASEEHLALFEEVVNFFEVEYVPGGCTLNTLRVCQWLMSSNSSSTVFSGCIGNDRFGKILENRILKEGVETSFIKSENSPTGKAVSLITKGGNRSLVGLIAAANDYKYSDLCHYESKLKQASFIYQSSWFLLAPEGPKCIKQLANQATQNGQDFALNLSAPMVIESHIELLMELIPHTTFLFGNNTEAIKFAEAMNWPEDIRNSVSEIAKKIAKINISHNYERIVIITQGPTETIFASSTGLYNTFPTLQINQNLVIDTTGAGDAFCGGFISHLLKNPRNPDTPISMDKISDAITTGHWAAREIIQRYGCSYPDVCKFDLWQKNLALDTFDRANA